MQGSICSVAQALVSKAYSKKGGVEDTPVGFEQDLSLMHGYGINVSHDSKIMTPHQQRDVCSSMCLLDYANNTR